MMMKRLFRYTTSLLRTVLLLGAMILVSTQTQAQVMPDAFETVDPSTIIGNGKFYYIQFYEDLKTTCFDRAYLSDTGAGGELWTKDYIPFAKNILWTLEATGTTNQFRLKSGEGNYIYLDSNDANKYKLTSDQGNATILTFYHRSDGGYEISTAANQNVSMCRDHRNVWAFVANYSVNGDRHTYIGNCLRFAQLKDNVAHIIYYQDVDDFDPNGSGRYTDIWYRPHHYLTYSGSNWTSLIEEDDDNACFLTKEAPATYPTPSVITSGVGSTGSGIVIHSPAISQYDHETQFFIRFSKPISAGRQIYLEFDYKASQNCHVGTQAHGEPGSYQHHTVIDGGLDFTTSWNHYSGSITVSSEMAGTNGMQTIAFNLAMGSETTFYFDNIVMLVDEPDTEHKFVSSRSSIFRQYSEWYSTAAAYHQDGLWILEQVGNSGEFSIKKYGGTDNEYITVDYQDVGICYGLGAQSNKAIFVLGDYNARRYASLKNTITNKYVNYTNGDGANVFDMAGSGIQSTTGHTWYAGFLPVEVPVPNKDDFYQVVLTFNSGTAMVNENGGYAAYNADNPVLWQIEQVDDYTHFHFRNPKNGKYLVSDGVAVDYYEDARVYSWADVMNDFVLEWRYVNPVKPETVVPYNVTHKVSYLQQYAQSGLGKQGLATDADSDWKNADGTQKVNLFEITHYVKKGQTIQVGFPTVLNQNNDHIYYQRWYKFGDDTNLEDLQSHVNLSTSADGTVQYYLYNNGMVTGEKLYWETRKEGMKQKALRYFNFTNSDCNAFIVAADVSRYSDFKYEYPGAPLTGDLEEPSLTMRYLFYMKDAKVIAKALTGYPEQAGVADKNVWKETGPVCTEESKWYEKKIFHFPATPLPYENEKWAGYRGEFIGLYHVFSDYWVFNDGDVNSTDDNNLVSAVNDNYGGKIEVRIYDPNGTGIRLGGWNPNIDPKGTTEGNDEDYQGFYFYDKVARNLKTQYGDSRFIVFRYPKDGDGKATSVTNTGKEAYIHVYFNNNGTRYQLAQFTVIFDENSDTRPWTSVNNSAQVQGSDRDPVKLRKMAGRPIAKITFDYPDGEGVTYHYPASTADDPLTRHDGHDDQYGTIGNSSPIPLKFDNTNYAFDGDGCNWGSYAMVTTKWTQWGNGKTALPANDATHGYDIDPDDNLQSAFLYIDASEQPGDICSADFQGEFCAGDKLICSGWISGSNRYSDNGEYRCPGGITLTVKGERIEDGQKETIYRFCPGQCYELDNGEGTDGSDNVYVEITEPQAGQTVYYKDNDGKYVATTEPPSGQTLYALSKGGQVVWQQFYFEFGTNQKFKRYWMEVNNNCVSSNGGDFMLDNVEVFALVPEVIPEMNTPVCVNKDASEMQLLKLNIGFDKILAATNSTEVTDDGAVGVKKDISFVFLEKDKFLTTFQQELHDQNGVDISIEDLEKHIEKGDYGDLVNDTYATAYRNAFDAAILGDKTKTWDSDSYTEADLTAAVLNYHWSTKFREMEPFNFAKAVNGQGSVFRETDTESGERFIVINGNYPNKLPWKMDTGYYVIPYQSKVTEITDALYEDFNICSACCKKSEFRLDPSIQILSMEASDVTEELVVCEGKIPTLVTNLTSYDIKGNEVKMKNLNFDWWLGNKTAVEPEDRLATLDNYHMQYKLIDEAGEDIEENRIYLAYALSIMRAYYPGITSLDGVTTREEKAVHLEDYMINYLREVVDKGELLLHQSAISVPAEQVLDSDPYFYLVACPIHDEAFNQALNPSDNEYVAFYCDEPQGVRIKLGQKAPRLQTGFVPGEHGFTEYHYDFPANTTPVLSIRLAKAAQFETVKNNVAEDAAVSTDVNYLWLPIRNAETEGADGVIKKSQDDNIYLASSNDLTWDKKISKEMNKNGLLPIVGRIVQLQAVNTKNNSSADENANNRLCVYFNKDFNVREGYNYTLSLPFQEELDGEGNSQNACDGTILINLKIVPDYEVWTAGAGNTDWNNDENWRRADGNTTISNDVYGDELYRANGAVDDAESPLHNYTTNKNNYYSSSTKASAKPSSDQVLRKGFAPLYCTHILMKSDEWGNAPVLYDAIDGHDEIAGSRLISSPFPNLRDTSTPILKFDMQARKYDMWKETYGDDPDRGSADRPDDLIAEMYQINSCEEIAMQPGTELRNAELLNYNNAWMEFELDAKRWYLLGSPLQGTISGEWYAPTATEEMGNVPQQRTTYYDDVTFGEGYDRYNPAIYQRSWDKAKAVLYEVGADYAITDDAQTNDDDVASQGQWGDTDWNTAGADLYLDRLGYKPFGEKKANVAIKGIWSNTYNDAQVDYATGGFSVMVMNHLKGKDADVKAIVRLPKEDTMYDYYKYSEDGSDNGGTDTYLVKHEDDPSVQVDKGRALNRGRLKTDRLLPTQDGIQKQEKEVDVNAGETYRYGDRRWITRIPIKEADLNTMNSETFSFTETVAAGASDLGYYLVENPFPCGLDMAKFFEVNGYSEQDNPDGLLQKKYWLLTKADDGQNPRQVLVQLQQESGDVWITSDGTVGTPIVYYPDPNDAETTSSFYPQAVLAPGQGFFVQAKTGVSGNLTVTFNKDMQAQSRFGVIKGKGKTYKIVVGQAQVMQKMFDSDGNGMPETVFLYDSDGDGKLDKIPETLISAGNIWIDTDGDGAPDRVIRDTDFDYEGEMIWIRTGDDSFDVKNVLTEIVYETDEVTGEEVPKLMDIEEDVVIYKYVPETLTTTLDDPTTTEEDESETTEKEHPLLARTRGEAAMSLPGLVITAKRGADETSALVMQRESASNDFLPEEDTETFITSDFESVPTVYTLCGRLATTINSIHDFRCLPVGVESNSNAPCTLTFQGVEALGDSVAFYDAVEQTLIPLKSGMQVSVSGQTQNRYYLVRSLIKEEAAAETHLQIFTEGLTAKVIASTAEPILNVRCFDTAGRLIHSASPETAEYSFSLPRAGIYIIEAETENDHKTKKVMTK